MAGNGYIGSSPRHELGFDWLARSQSSVFADFLIIHIVKTLPPPAELAVMDNLHGVSLLRGR